MNTNKAKYTPGPWTEGPYKTCPRRVINRAGELVAQVHSCGRGTLTIEATARLIAAAPELLSALENIAEMADNSGDRAILETARAAIAKAKGE